MFRVKLVRPVPADRNRRHVLQKGKHMETSSRTMPLCTTVFSFIESDDAVTTCGLPGIMEGRGSVSVHKDKYVASKDGT